MASHGGGCNLHLVSLLGEHMACVGTTDPKLYRLQEETAKVEEHLLRSGFTEAVVQCFSTSKANAFENLLEPLQKLLRLSPLVAQSLGRPDLFSRILQKLSHNKAIIRLNLLRIIRSICDSNDEQGGLLQKYGLFEAIQRLAEGDPAVLVRNMASELIKSAVEWDQHYNSLDRRRRSRRASSSTTSSIMPGSPFPPLLPPPPSTPLGRPGLPSSSSSYLETFEKRSQSGIHGVSGAKLNFRPVSRDGALDKKKKTTTTMTTTMTNSNANANTNPAAAAAAATVATGSSNVGKSRLPRSSSSHRLARLSFGVVGSDKPENKTPVTPSISRITSPPRRRPLVGDPR